MKNLATVILLGLFCMINLHAQDTKTSSITPIDDHYFPTYNSDFHYFFLRKNSRLGEGLIGHEMNFHNNRINSKSKIFIPFVNNKKWNYVVPIYYDQHQFTSANDETTIDTEYRNFFFQSVLSYYANNKLTLTSIIEGRIRGNEKSHFDSRGNMLAHYFVTKYQLSEKLAISPAILVGHQWNVDNEFVFFPSLELKWNPNENFALMAGVPGLLGIEWSIPNNIDIVLHSMVDNGILTLNASVRKRFTNFFELTLRYDQDGYGNTYLPSAVFNTANEVAFNYNQLSQKEKGISAILSFKASKELLFQVKGGYNFDLDLMLSNNDNELISIDGATGFYGGLGVYWRFKK